MPSVYFYIQSAFRKLAKSQNKNKSCLLTKEEVRAIALHHAIPDAIGDFDAWEFDENGEILTEI